MDQETAELQEPSFADRHPWLELPVDPEEDSIEEVIRYTLDEMRIA